MKNYYKILEVNKEASQDVISKVYKLLAKKYHPDMNPDNRDLAEKKFKEITEAYEILSDDSKRKNYDIQLEEYEKNAFENPKLQQLQNYCAELENEINLLREEHNKQNYNQYNTDIQRQNLEFQRRQQQAQAEAEAQAYGAQQAYNDAYVNTLRNMGYKIRYKQTFKQKCKNLLALIITIIIIAILLKVLWYIPAVREFLMPIYYILSLFGL